jgi:type I restriction enzyme M protein
VSDAKAIVDKLWNYCNILRDDGLSYGDYVEQLTYLLFLRWPRSSTSSASTGSYPKVSTGRRCSA